jgi:hypothetical protein
MCSLATKYTLLIPKLHSHWDEIYPLIPCPINFTEEEVEANIKDGQGWNDVADIWDAVEPIVQRDGWTANEHYEMAKDFFYRCKRGDFGRYELE